MAIAVIRLGQKCPERSAYPIHIEVYDEAGDALTPTSIRWTHYDIAGDVVNSKTQVSVTAADSFNIVLNATDTAVTTAGAILRRVLLEVSYNSATYGNNLIMNRLIEYDIEDIPKV